MSLPAAATFALARTFEELLGAERRVASSGASQRVLGGDLTTEKPARRHLREVRVPLEVRARTELEGRKVASLDEIERVVARFGGACAPAAAENVVGAQPRATAASYGGAGRGRQALRAAHSLRRLLLRAHPTSRELRVLHSALQAMESRHGV
eukprot:1621022-Prymnesium_polylepis.1